MTDQTDKATADFVRAVELNPDFPIAYVQKLYTDYRYDIDANTQDGSVLDKTVQLSYFRRASTSQDSVAVKNVVNLFEQALEKHPKCVETYALFAQVKPKYH